MKITNNRLYRYPLYKAYYAGIHWRSDGSKYGQLCVAFYEVWK